MRFITILLEKDKDIERIRKEFGINTKKYLPHINIVYPFDYKDEKKLDKIIRESLKGIRSFEITLKGIKKSRKGKYLYLLVDKGARKIRRIYKRLHKGELKKFKNKNMPRYIPHLTLGNFKTKKEQREKETKAKKEKLFFEAEVKVIKLVTMNKNGRITKIKNYRLE